MLPGFGLDLGSPTTYGFGASLATVTDPTGVDWSRSAPGEFHMGTCRGAAVRFVAVLTGFDGVDRDLSGYSAALLIRRRIGDVNPVVTLDTAGGDLTIFDTNKIEVNIPSLTTNALSGDNVYSLSITTGGVVEYVLSGDLFVSKSMTDLVLT